jgi:hypothetical protein
MGEQDLQIIDELKQPMALGEVFSKSGMWPDVKSQAQACVKILAGKELGLLPFESMGSIYMVNGRLALSSKAMAGLIKRSKKYDYVIKKLDETECSIDITGQDGVVGNTVFTFKDAAKAGLVNKDNWKSYPKNMLFARALSNACRFYCPEIIGGYITYEEAEDLISEIIPAKTTVAIDVNAEVKNGTEKA